MFPIINAQGRVLGFGGRAMGDAQPKYLNTAETPIFNKRLGLYALNMAQKERSIGHLVLVEGYMDTVSLRKHGVQGVVATLGTALTEEQAKLMKRYAPEVWISYDGDSAGQKAALRALDILDQQEIPARVIDYPAGMDPDDYVKQKGLEGFNALPKYDSTEYRMIRARDGLDISLQDDMTQYALKCCSILKKVKNPVEMENHLRRLVNETGYDRETLLRQIGVIQQKEPKVLNRRPAEKETAATDAVLAERALISLLSLNAIPREMVQPADFSDELHKTLAEWLISGKSVNAYIEALADNGERNRAMRALNYSPLPDERDEALKMAENCISTIRKNRLSERIRQIQQEIGSASPQKKMELYQQMADMMKELED
jgi:DNA primase